MPPRWPGADLRWLGRALLSHRGRVGQPFKITFAVTDACQSGCQVCSIWRKRPENELSVAEIRRIFRSAPRFSWVDLTGGEPFLREDIAEVALAVLEECSTLGLLHPPTNGLDPDRVERETMKILAHGPRRLVMTVSIDGPPELNVVLRGHPEAWNAAIETFSCLRRLRSSSFDVLLGITLSAANEEEAGQIFADGCLCFMEVLAVQSAARGRAFSPVQPKMQCEAWDYGSSFSRGMRIDVAGSGLTTLSGTASIAPSGETAHVGDPGAQLQTTLANLESLLEACGKPPRVPGPWTLYFKNYSTWQAWCEAVEAGRLVPPSGPAVFADVCRDDLLFEAEVTLLT